MPEGTTKTEPKIESELRYQMNKIDELFKDLGELIHSSELVSAQVFQLPPVAIGEEHNKVSEISVSAVTGETAFFKAMNAFRKVYAEDGMSMKSVFRLPGYIQIDADRSKVKALVSAINHEKDQFKELVKQIEGAKKKHDIVHGLFPGLITKQLYRRLHAVNSDISQLGFCWAQRFVTTKTTREEVIAKIKGQIKNPPLNTDPDDWETFLNREITDIQRLSASIELRHKRPAKVNAVVNLDCDEAPQLSAHLPLIIVQKNPICVSPLLDFNAAFRRCVRSDSVIGGKPIIGRLHLYEKRSC
ncbi:DNA replication terminus site-binding protein [Vibrio parahaemolyticus]|nr:DNA replication terminus site-binding protein [Vibrio parahaemolyticus]